MKTAGLPAGGGRGSFAARVGLFAGLAVLATGGGIASAGAPVQSSSRSFGFAADPPAHSSANAVDSRVKIAGLTGSVTGGVKSKTRKCEKGRLASLLHVTFAGFEFVDTEKTTRKGKFALEGAVPGQTYFVGVGKKTVTKFRFGRPPKKLLCTETESDTFVP